MARDHLRSDVDDALTLCGMPIVGAWPRPLPIVGAIIDSKNPCRDCTRIDARPPSAPPPERSATPAGPYTPVYGARELGASALRALAPERQREAEESHIGPRWASSEAAVRSYVRARTELERFGVLIRSSAAPSDHVQHGRDASLGGREHAQMDRYRNVSLALDRAVLDPEMPATLGADIAPWLGRRIFEWAVAGRPRDRATRQGNRELKGRVLEWLAWPHEEIATRVNEDRGLALDEHDVTHVRRVFRGHVADALLASGEIGEIGIAREGGPDAARDGLARWATRLGG